MSEEADRRAYEDYLAYQGYLAAQEVEDAAPQQEAPQAPAAPKAPPVVGRGAGLTAPGLDLNGMKGVGEGMLGAADIATTMATGGVGTVFGGLAGMTVGAAKKDPELANRAQEQVQAALTWSPKTEAGKAFFEGVGKVLDPAMTKTRDAIAFLAMDYPPVAALLETVVFGAPEILAAGKLGTGAVARRKLGPLLENRLKTSAERLGIDLNNNTVRPSTIAAAEKMTGEARSRAQTGIEDIGPAVQAAEKAGRTDVNALYTKARETAATLSYKPIADAVEGAFESIRQRGFDIEGSAHLKARIQELVDLDARIPGVPGNKGARPGSFTEGTPASAIVGPDGKPLTPATMPVKQDVAIPLNDLELINTRISSSIKTVGAKSPEGAALIELRRHMNRMIDDQFDKDMISGDPAAKARWTEAKAANTAHKQRFHSDKAIRTIVKGGPDGEGLDAAQTAKLLLGASETKHQLGATRTVKKLKKILGEDAPELEAVRTSMMVDMVSPIFQEKPNWNTAVRRIEQVEKNSPALLQELNISKADLDILKRAMHAASIAVDKGDLDLRGFFAASIGRLTVGHDIAKAAVHVKLVNMLADRVLGVGQKTHKQLLREFTGDELAKNPIIANMHPSKKALLANAAVIAELQAAGENPEDR